MTQLLHRLAVALRPALRPAQTPDMPPARHDPAWAWTERHPELVWALATIRR